VEPQSPKKTYKMREIKQQLVKEDPNKGRLLKGMAARYARQAQLVKEAERQQ